MAEVIKSYKGFNKDMTCRGFQFEEGKEYEEDGADVCNKGFHACEMPLDVLNYYPPASSVYHEVEQGGEISKSGVDSKVASSKIKIGAEVGIKGLVRAQIEFVKEKCGKTKKEITGYWSANVSTGRDCTNSGGEATLCAGWGKDNKCKGVIGSYLVLSEWGDWDGAKFPLLTATMICVDGKKYKADTWYILKDGKVVEWEEE